MNRIIIVIVAAIVGAWLYVEILELYASTANLLASVLGGAG